MISRTFCPQRSLDEQIAAQHAAIARFESALWDEGFNGALLPSYQSAWRRLESLYAQREADTRHHFKLLIPVADSPRQLQACLNSLLDLMRVYTYGGLVEGKYARVSVVVADDSLSVEDQTATRAVVEACAATALSVEYFGQCAQADFLKQLSDSSAANPVREDEPAIALASLIGTPRPGQFGHKGQAAMRNLAALWLARTLPDPAHTLVHTLDADQRFDLPVAGASGEPCALAVNFYARLDQIFRNPDIVHLTGKVVGDPPVSPAAMAATFLDDVAELLLELAAADPHAPWPQAPVQTGADAAYHDMATLFGFAHNATFRYRPRAATSCAAVFDEFAARLQGFFHGEHPTRLSLYAHQPALESVAPARTVYTGNWVWRADAPDACIPFAPLRLRMSGPTMGRLLRAAKPSRFVAAHLPMRHTRTLDETRASEFRPGVVESADGIDLSDEFARQFVGDVMLFTVERLTQHGYPDTPLDDALLAATLDTVYAEMRAHYAERHLKLRDTLAALTTHFEHAAPWWHDGHDNACAQFRAFFANMRRNFDVPARHDAPGFWPAWRARQLDALKGYDAGRARWQQALA